MAVKELWNEGRVSGYSAYETYVKQHLAENPDIPPASEREWLSSSLAMGDSLILKVPKISAGKYENKIYDIQFPAGSRLGAANTIIASFFDGDGVFNGQWAIRVTDYGQTISNTTASHPSGVRNETATIPTKTLDDYDQTTIDRLKDYLSIYDATIIQPGDWHADGNKPPESDFTPDLSRRPRLRLCVKGSILNEPRILLTGFTIRSVLLGTAGQDTSSNTDAAEDGDFLGPAVYPWASKVFFYVPTSYATFFLKNPYTRKIMPPDTDYLQPNATSFIDQESPSGDNKITKPVAEYYYASRQSTDSKFYWHGDTKANSRVPVDVKKFATLGDGMSVLTVYERKGIYPPALFSTFTTKNGTNYLHPLDCVAPGSVKMFADSTQSDMQEYQNTFPGTTAINKLNDGYIELLDKNNQIVHVVKLDRIPGGNNPGSSTFTHPSTARATENDNGANTPDFYRIQAGKYSAFVLGMSKGVATGEGVDPSRYTISANPTGVISLDKWNSSDNLSWAEFLAALKENKAIDLLNTRLKSAKYTLIDQYGYLEFGPESNIKRLYISSNQPGTSGVPNGSIGIGWGI